MPDFRKSFDWKGLIPLLPKAENIDYWRQLNPDLTISDRPFQGCLESPGANQSQIDAYKLKLREEGYFQTEPVIPTGTVQQMKDCAEKVKQAGFPPMFALVYDVFYEAFASFHSTLIEILGTGYKLIPNFWLYYIEPNDGGKGFEPHRDAEYENTIDAHGMPTVLTFWISVTEANPYNSCMYILPANRDPEYKETIANLKTGATKFALEDVRALPTAAGTVSFWDQYVFHWGSRSSKHAPFPRISYAAYCQRGDVPLVDNAAIDIPSTFEFPTRLAMVCRGLHRYSYFSLREVPEAKPLLDFMNKHMERLKKT